MHINSGIPNHAFYLASVAVGGNAWETTGQVWYAALRDPSLRPDADFAAFAALTVRLGGEISAAIATRGGRSVSR